MDKIIEDKLSLCCNAPIHETDKSGVYVGDLLLYCEKCRKQIYSFELTKNKKMNPLKDKYDVGVIVGRFQVAELTDGHKYVIDSVRESHKQVIVAIGVSEALGTKKNPLGYAARMQMIQETFPDVIITHIMDTKDDEKWSRTLDKTIRALCPMGSVCLYGSRDSFIKTYKGRYPTFELAVINEEAGTRIREEIGKTACNSKDFRAGVIHSCQNQYPKVFPTVDMAVVKGKQVLLGRRTADSALRFPGGFVDPSDATLEDAARRELSEEVDVAVAPECEYLGSFIINDWRYKTPDEKIMTTLFKFTYLFGAASVIDEFDSFEWVEIKESNLDKIESGHEVLFQRLIKNIKKEKV